MTSEAPKKAVTLSYGVFAAILLATLLVGLVSGSVFGTFVMYRVTNRPALANGQALPAARAWMGVTYIPITPPLAESRKLPVASGALVVSVADNSPAAKANLHEDDIITAIDQRVLDDSTSLMDAIKGKAPGDKVQVTFLRNGSAQVVEVILGRSPIGPDNLDGRNPLDQLRRGIQGIWGR